MTIGNTHPALGVIYPLEQGSTDRQNFVDPGAARDLVFLSILVRAGPRFKIFSGSGPVLDF